MADAYTPEWEDKEFERLAPAVESTVNRIYANRGGRSGVSQAILARRLANLRAEIARDASTKKATLDEQKRREGVAADQNRENWNRQVGERTRQENQARMERDLERTRQDRAAQETRAYNEKLLGEQRGFWRDLYGMNQPKAQGTNASTDQNPDIYGDQTRKRRRDDEFDPSATVDNLMQSDTSLRGSTFGAVPFLSNGYNNASRGFFNPAPPVQEAKGPRDFSQNSGDINAGTVTNEPRKFWNDVTDTADQIGKGFKDAFDSLFTPRLGGDPSKPAGTPGSSLQGPPPSVIPQGPAPLAGVNGITSNDMPYPAPRGFRPQAFLNSNRGGVRQNYGMRA